MIPHVSIGVNVHAAVATARIADAAQPAAARPGTNAGRDLLTKRTLSGGWPRLYTPGPMRLRPLAVAFALSSLASGALVVACSSSNVETQTPDASSSEPTSKPDVTAVATGTGTIAIPNGAIPDLASCKDLPVESINEMPDAGTTMTNASPKGDAGVSDRLVPADAIIKSARDRFRCCFDAGGKHARGTETKLLMVVELKPNGAVRSITFDPAKSDKVEQPITDCMVAVANALTYPESADGTDTIFRYPFAFRGRQ